MLRLDLLGTTVSEGPRIRNGGLKDPPSLTVLYNEVLPSWI